MQGTLVRIRDLVQQRLGAILLPIFTRLEWVLRRVDYYLGVLFLEFKKLPAPIKDIVIWLSLAVLGLAALGVVVQLVTVAWAALAAGFGAAVAVITAAIGLLGLPLTLIL